MASSTAMLQKEFNISHWFAQILTDIHDMLEISFLVISFLKEFKLICLHTTVATVSTQLNGFNYFYLKLIILFNINNLFAHSEVDTTFAI